MGSGNKPGSWRNRSHEDANTIVRTPSAKKWYQQTFWIVFFLVVFWPAGLVFAWRSDWHIVAKIVATVLLAAVIFMSWNLYQAVLAVSAA